VLDCKRRRLYSARRRVSLGILPLSLCTRKLMRRELSNYSDLSISILP
jgi:hypothetical protein